MGKETYTMRFRHVLMPESKDVRRKSQRHTTHTVMVTVSEGHRGQLQNLPMAKAGTTWAKR